MVLYDVKGKHPAGVVFRLLDLLSGADSEWLNFGDDKNAGLTGCLTASASPF